MWVSSVVFSIYLDKDDDVWIPLSVISWLRDDLTRLHRRHLKDLHGTVFPESPRPQLRVIPNHARLSFPFFLKTVIRRDILFL